MIYKNNLEHCTLCPRNCNAKRYEKKGICRASEKIEVSSIIIHKGEEPVLSGKHGILNVFFANCNLRCIYCQNYQISLYNQYSTEYSVDKLVNKIKQLLPPEIYHIGWVTPTHYANYIPEITEKLKRWRDDLKFVYNTSAYDKPNMIKELKDYVDVYLPDFKYSLPEVAYKYSKARDYTEFAIKSITEMIYQKGTTLQIDDNGLAISGVIIRHLVLPENINNSLKVLDILSDNFGINLWISLMSQYTPIKKLDLLLELQRPLKRKEYKIVVNYMQELGFHHGWVQDLESIDYLFPDFSNKSNPF